MKIYKTIPKEAVMHYVQDFKGMIVGDEKLNIVSVFSIKGKAGICFQ